MNVPLAPAAGVLAQGQEFVAISNDAWLEFADPAPFAQARFIEIVYRASLYDDPVRPLLKFVGGERETLRLLPGPIAGAGLWRGAVPRGVERVFISPCARVGRFAFVVESLRALSLFDMATLVWRKRRGQLWAIALASAFGFFAEAERAMDWGIGGEPPEKFEDWRALRERAFDAAGLDAPRFDWRGGPVFLILVDRGGQDDAAVERTRASLDAQAYRNFVLATSAQESASLLATADFVCHLRAGDALAPHALALVAEEAARSVGVRLFYGDEIALGPQGARPCLKPGWSPRFERARAYIGRALFLRSDLLDAENLSPNGFRAAALGVSASETFHIRRFLLTREEEAPSSPPAPAVGGAGAPSVSIVLLTRDRANLLEPCLASLLGRSTHSNYELLIVDNGTTQAKALHVLDAAAADRRVRVLRRPGPFLFAAHNNDAAREAKGDVLVFLNNDTEILTPDWLEQLSLAATEPDVGAVGALLLYPDGRVQHAGIVVGLGEEAGHFEALGAPEASSWLGRNLFAHETAAVTGACLAVERRKFEAVNGFDADSFPVESNDVDLCLRLAARGWPALYLPSVRLIHKESASRGDARMRPMSVYARERGLFRARWGHVVRDDPYFHPGLSLYCRQTALG